MKGRELAEILERLSSLLRADSRRRGLPAGLQPVHVETLLYLARCNRYSNNPQAVAEYLALTKGTVSQSLKVLERGGWIEKAADAEDRRKVRLLLTASGEQLAEDLAEPPALQQALADGEPPADRLTDDLRRLLAGMQRATGNRSFGICETCRFFQREEEGFRCGLTGEGLSVEDSRLICREHEEAGICINSRG